MRLVPDLSPVGWFLFGAMVLLIFTYLDFWWMVIKASAHKHVSREKVTNRTLTASLAHAKRKGNTHRFLIQITTKGGAKYRCYPRSFLFDDMEPRCQPARKPLIRPSTRPAEPYSRRVPGRSTRDASAW